MKCVGYGGFWRGMLLLKYQVQIWGEFHIFSSWGTSKQHMKLQQPRNHDFRVSQFDPPRSQSSNDRETTTSPPGHLWEVLRGKCCTHNDRQTTTIASQQPWNDDFCRIVQRPRNATTVKWQVRNCTFAANFASDFVSLCGCCRFKCLLEVSDKWGHAYRDKTKGTNYYLRIPALFNLFCENLRFSAKIWSAQVLHHLSTGRLCKICEICENAHCVPSSLSP